MHFHFRPVASTAHKKCDMDKMAAHVRAHVHGNGDFLKETELQSLKGDPMDVRFLDMEKVLIRLKTY